MTQIRAIFAIVKKDIMVFIRKPIRILVTIVPALVLLLILVLQGDAVSGSPIAIVNEDAGGAAASELIQTAQDYDGFLKTSVLSMQQAQVEYNNLQVAGILIVPAGFSQDISMGNHPSVTWQVRNFNDDTANDLRRALPDIVNTFISHHAFNQMTGANPVHIQIQESDLHPKDAGFIPFELIAVLVVFLLQASLVNAGLALVSEWESGSIKELLVSPASLMTLIGGKVIGGVITCDLVGCVTVGAAWVAGLLPRLTLYGVWMALLTGTLLSIFGSGIGVALASKFRSTEKTSLIAILISFYLFFLSGGIVVLAYLPPFVQIIARFVPNTYAMDLLRNALLYQSNINTGGNLLVLCIAAALGLLIGIPSMRRGLSH